MKLEFFKPRSFGNRLADTFTFLMQNFKPFSKGLLTITLPLLFAYMIVAFLFYSNYFSIFGLQNIQYADASSMLSILWIIPMLLLLGITAVFVIVVTLSYIKLYNNDKEREITPSLLWKETKRYFWRVLGANLLIGVVFITVFATITAIMAFTIGDLMVGDSTTEILAVFLIFLLILLITPVIVWFFTKITFFPIFIVNEEKDVIQSFKDSYKFTKGIFWRTLGFVILLSLIVSTAAQILNSPSTMLMYLNMFMDIGSFSQHLASVLMAIGSSVGLLLYCVLYIGCAIFYFSEIEQRYGIIANREIDEIGR